MNNISEKICSYIKVEYMNNGIEVKPEHTLTKDLGLHGDHGVHFIEDFAKAFRISFAEMTITRHFACKNSFAAISEAIGNIIKGKKPFSDDLIDLKVSDLIAAVEQGEWSDKILEARIN